MNVNFATKPTDLALYKYYMDIIKKAILEAISKSKRDKKDYKIKITLEESK